MSAARIELCGAVAVTTAAAAIREVGDSAVVRVNRYGFESLEQAASYKTAFATDDYPGDAAFFFLSEEPTALVHRDGVFVAGVVSVDELRVLAMEVQTQGAGLIELYGGFGAVAAAAVREATGERLPVGWIDWRARAARISLLTPIIYIMLTTLIGPHPLESADSHRQFVLWLGSSRQQISC